MKNLLIYLIGVCAFAQAPNIQWQKYYGGTDIDSFRYIRATNDGYIVGGVTGSNDNDVSGNHGSADIWLVKTDFSGNLQWQKCFGGTLADGFSSVEPTSDGGFIAVGQTFSTDGDVTGNHGGGDIWVFKTDALGNLQWQKCLGGTLYDYPSKIKQTIDNGYILSCFAGSINGDVTGNHGGEDAWIIKLSNTGNIEWQKCYGGTDQERAEDILQTTDGGYIFVASTASIDGDVVGHIGSSPNQDFWVVKINSTGTIEWQKCYGGTQSDIAYNILNTIDGGYLIAGISTSNDVDVSGNHGSDDGWLAKITNLGVLQWQKCIGGSGIDHTYYRLIQTTDGGFLITSVTNSNDGDVSGNHGGYDAWIVKLNNAGVLQWQKCFGGTQNDGASSILQTNDGGFVFAGGTRSNDGDVTGNHSSSDAWLVKLGPDLSTAGFEIERVGLFPNPNNGNFSIQTENEIKTIEIYDVLGQLVFVKKEMQIGNNNIQTGLKTGVYFVKLTTENKEVATKKMIVQ